MPSPQTECGRPEAGGAAWTAMMSSRPSSLCRRLPHHRRHGRPLRLVWQMGLQRICAVFSSIEFIGSALRSCLRRSGDHRMNEISWVLQLALGMLEVGLF